MQTTSKQYGLQPTIKPNDSFLEKRRKAMSRNKNQNQKPKNDVGKSPSFASFSYIFVWKIRFLIAAM